MKLYVILRIFNKTGEASLFHATTDDKRALRLFAGLSKVVTKHTAVLHEIDFNAEAGYQSIDMFMLDVKGKRHDDLSTLNGGTSL